MAVLQAARAKTIGFSQSEAKGWGLNRAIFYAIAKQRFKKRQLVSRRAITKKSVLKTRRIFSLGDEMAYVSRKGNRTYFTIGKELQTEGDFKRQIEKRFGETFKNAWKEALEIVGSYPKEVLLSQNRFFGEVYKPRRDALASRWTELSEKS